MKEDRYDELAIAVKEEKFHAEVIIFFPILGKPIQRGRKFFSLSPIGGAIPRRSSHARGAIIVDPYCVQKA